MNAAFTEPKQSPQRQKYIKQTKVMGGKLSGRNLLGHDPTSQHSNYCLLNSERDKGPELLFVGKALFCDPRRLQRQ
ncbi:unnamed protein product [Colias eurytheme]|nr:unnamed protein product [Colias eurytheme]